MHQKQNNHRPLRFTIIRACLLIALATLAACGDDDSPYTISAEVQAACAKLDQCNAVTSAQECEKTFGSQTLTDACLTAIAQAPCSEHQQSPTKASYRATCWDLCTTTDQQCKGHALHACYRGVVYKYDCGRLCRLRQDRIYMGSCGTSVPTGETSKVPVCWCQK